MAKKILKGLGMILAALILLVAISAVSLLLYVRKYYKSDMTMIDAIVESVGGSVNSYSDDHSIMFVPADHRYKAVIVFYPGGKVEYTAYSPLMYRLADRGYLCVLLKMPGNLAVFNVDAATSMMRREHDRLEIIKDLDWYIAGHSLGGAAAATYLDEVIDGETEIYHDRGAEGEYSGIILCGSYTVEDFSDDDIRLLSIYGSEDGVLNRDSYDSSIVNWPEDSEEYVIRGGNHAYFGCYGEQAGDGTATITNEQQLDITAQVIDEWINAG